MTRSAAAVSMSAEELEVRLSKFLVSTGCSAQHGIMADKKDEPGSTSKQISPSLTRDGDAEVPPSLADAQVQDEQQFQVSESRKIGVTGAVFLILNKMIGTGSEYQCVVPSELEWASNTKTVFSTPSGIFASTGSVGISLILWLFGGILTFAGMSVFLEYGLAIPRSGGEKNYLERVYRHPKYLATCVLASQMILLGFSTGNSLAFGRYVLFASGSEQPDGWLARGLGIICVTFAVLLHALLPKWGVRLVNVLGIFKVVVLLFIVFSGFAALAGHRRVPDPHNFDNAFRTEEGEGYGNGGLYGYATALLRIIYSYKGWENANYVLGELKEPRRTLAVAAPLAVGGVTILYVLANVAYFAAIPKGDLATSEVIVAGLFFRNVFGDSAGARSLPVFVALSNLGNVLAVSFAHARVNQELAKEGLLPFSKFWASNKPMNAPAASVSAPSHVHCGTISLTCALALPPLDRHGHRPGSTPSWSCIQLHRRPLHVPRCLDQLLCRRWAHLPALHRVGELDVAVAYLPSDFGSLSGHECVPGHCAVHSTDWKLERRRISILHLSSCWSGCPASWSRLLDILDQSTAEYWWVQGRGRADCV